MQVPSFDNKVAMTMIQQELGRPWQELYSQLTPRPIAAASLGQVCHELCNLFVACRNASMQCLITSASLPVSPMACIYYLMLVLRDTEVACASK